MYSLIQLKTFVSCGRDPVRSLPLRRGFLLIPLILVCFAFSPQMQAQEGDLGGGNTNEGFNALLNLSGGGFNTGMGWYSQWQLTDGFFNTAVGAGSLDLNNGNSNTAAGTGALLLNITANNNTSVGTDALLFNDFTSTSPSTANDNTAVGFQALFNNLDAFENTAVGSGALFSNDSSGNGVANGNTAVGFQALFANVDGVFNDAVGADALTNNTDGFSNNAFGDSALFSNGTCVSNTAIGDIALGFNDSSGNGIAHFNTAVGAGAMTLNVDGFQNTVVGAGAGNNIVVGGTNTYVGQFVGSIVPDESSTIRIADISIDGFGSAECFIGGIFNNFQPAGGSVVEVTIDLADDHLGWDIPPSAKGVTPPVQRSVPSRRSAPSAPAQRPTKNQAMNDKVEKLQVVVQMQQKQIVALTAQLKEQATQIDKVSAQLEMIKPAPRVVENR
jgi:hypothetical protein